MKELIKKSLQDNDIILNNLTGFSSDGAAVMTGAKTGEAAQLQRMNPRIINIHSLNCGSEMFLNVGKIKDLSTKQNKAV